ncbi:MAG TPA: alpha/beta hydrolase [Thermoanaerobaculia bacterium]|nr:alpha/beta hydrolase [Thermoanaerobaculia bacterium]
MAVKKSKGSIVLLHGLGGSSEDWKEVATLLAKDFTVRALDLPGSFRGPPPGTGYETEPLARWVLGEIGPETVLLAGHSLGGRVAGEVAALAPGQVRALALVSPLGSAPYGLTDRLKWIAMSRRAVIESVPESSLRSAAGYGFSVDGPGRAGFVARTVAARTGPRREEIVQAIEKLVDGVLASRPLAERLSGTSMPLLLVTGARDPLAPAEELRAILSARKDATLVELRGIGHYALLEDPPRLAATLRDFFEVA